MNQPTPQFPAEPIRPARPEDAGRLAEIEIFNYRLNFYPIFRDDRFYFDELRVERMTADYLARPALLERSLVYDDGVVKGFIRFEGGEVKKLFVEPALQGQAIGKALLEYAVLHYDVRFLWALEKNEKALRFYRRQGFLPTGERRPEEDTSCRTNDIESLYIQHSHRTHKKPRFDRKGTRRKEQPMTKILFVCHGKM